MAMNILRMMRRIPFLTPRRGLELYPPFWFMRIKVLQLDSDWRHLRIRLPLNFISRNMGNGMFGGYQASLADPIAALACNQVFPGHAVWTRSLILDFQSPGNSDLELRFDFDATLEAEIANDLAKKGRSTPTFLFGYYRQDGVLCTKVSNTVAIRPAGYRPK